MTTAKTLYILRHAKAEAGSSYQDDHQRTLMGHGIEAAEMLGKYLVRFGVSPDLVICSTAERARLTWQYASTAFKIAPPLEYSEKAYLASCNEMLALLAQTPESVSSLLLVGHNPGMHQLCIKLSHEGNEALIDTMMLKFPTCTFAAMGLGATRWADIADSQGKLLQFVTPDRLS